MNINRLEANYVCVELGLEDHQRTIYKREQQKYMYIPNYPSMAVGKRGEVHQDDPFSCN
jgi:hypothetical protein